jgi:acetyl esterase
MSSSNGTTEQQQNGLLQPLVEKEGEERERATTERGRGGGEKGGETKELTDRSDQSLLSFRSRKAETSSSSSLKKGGCWGKCNKFFSKVGHNCERMWLVSLFGLPEAVSSFLIRTVYGSRVSEEGKTLNNKIQILLEVTRTFGFDMVALMQRNVAKARKLFTKLFKVRRHTKVRVREISIPCGKDHQVAARIYTPEDLVSAESDVRAACPIPVLVYYHGGGWVLGSMDSVEGMLSQVAHWSKCTVVSVDYRLAPEHPHPAAVYDAIASFEWVAQNAAEFGWDEKKIAVGGDSAGGNLAAIVCQQAVLKNFEPRPSLQVLLFPALYLGNEPRPELKSMWEFGSEPFYLLGARDMAFYRNAYLGARDGMDITQSPLLAEGELLQRLPPAYFFLCHFDALRDEGREYARKLEQSGVRAVVEEFKAHHGFIYNFHRTQFAREGLKSIAMFLRNHMYPSKL